MENYASRLQATKKAYAFKRWRKYTLPQYTQESCRTAREIVDELLERLIKLGRSASEAEKIDQFKKATGALNVLNISHRYTFIESNER